jgi:hypothetical protein
MMIRTLLFASALYLASAKINLPQPKHIQIESLTPFDAPLDVNGEPVNFAGAIVIDGVSQTNHMDMNCNNKFCSMMEYAVVSKLLSTIPWSETFPYDAIVHRIIETVMQGNRSWR